MKYLTTTHSHRIELPCQRYVRQGGFSLIEVLVTMLILAFGLLGVAGLLVGGVSNAASSEAMAKANQLAADMADRIRANPTVALSATSQYLTNVTTWGEALPASTNTVALQDKKAWMEAVAAQLPQGQGRISNTVGGGARQVDIEVRWSNCLGTINDADRTACVNNSAAAFRTIKFELRL